MADKKPITSDKIYVPARLAFARLERPKQFNGTGTPRYEATFLIDPASKEGKEALHTLIKQAAKVAKEYFGVVPKAVKKVGAAVGVPGVVYDEKAKDDGIKFEALYDGDTKEYDGFKGMWALQTHTPEDRAPGIANRKGEAVLPGEDQFPYSGCTCRGSVTWWTQDNDFGKRVGINLRGVQFVKDGEEFGASSVDPTEEFTPMLEDEVSSTGKEKDPFED